jgi:hypothetical protein
MFFFLGRCFSGFLDMLWHVYKASGKLT